VCVRVSEGFHCEVNIREGKCDDVDWINLACGRY
jgi:hypothetical protein